MNLNKQAPKGSILLVISAVFLIISIYLLGIGLTTSKSDDGSGLGNSLGQSVIILAVIPLLVGASTGIIGYKRYRNSR
jgi:hypothetical protein